MSNITGFMPPQHWKHQRLTSIIVGTITGALAAGVLTDEESSSRVLKIIAGAVAGAVAGFNVPPPPDPRRW
jgi:outer membrane lipoprotein SlyB